MTTEKIKDLKLVRLSDYLTPEKFRIVPRDAIDISGGITEVRVVFNLHQEFGGLLTFDYSSILVIYGYAQLNDELRKINKHKYTAVEGKGVLKRITFNDCGELFIIVFELSDAEDKLVTVRSEEVAFLLNNCLHPSK